jgi:hypothetical protein
MSLVVAEGTSIPASARLILFCLIGVLLVILGFLIAFAVLIRRRPPIGPPTRSAARPAGATGGDEGDAAAMELVAVQAEGAVACPSCRREFDGGLQYCPHDSRRLVPAAEMIERARIGGGVCPRCRRAFDPGVRFCAHDSTELVPVTVYEATHGHRSGGDPVGVIAKICPQCRGRYDLAATFCGRDGAELAVIN